MKPAKFLSMAVALCGAIVISVTSALAAPPVNQTALLNPEAKAKQTATAKAALDKAEIFYTGKPYDADAQEYIFAARNYDPQVARWTAADPSGFPDGTNNHRYLVDPITQIDATGLFYSGTSYGSSKYGAGGDITDRAKWTAGVSTLGGILTSTAMGIADGDAGASSWSLDSSCDAAAQLQTLTNSTYSSKNGLSTDQRLQGSSLNKAVQTFMKDSYAGTESGSGSYSVSDMNFLFKNGTDGYYAFGNARISLSGDYTISNYTMSFSATVTIKDDFDFSPYSSLANQANSATGIGYRLQDSGYIHSFNTTGSWSQQFSARLE